MGRRDASGVKESGEGLIGGEEEDCQTHVKHLREERGEVEAERGEAQSREAERGDVKEEKSERREKNGEETETTRENFDDPMQNKMSELENVKSFTRTNINTPDFTFKSLLIFSMDGCI